MTKKEKLAALSLMLETRYTSGKIYDDRGKLIGYDASKVPGCWHIETGPSFSIHIWHEVVSKNTEEIKEDILTWSVLLVMKGLKDVVREAKSTLKGLDIKIEYPYNFTKYVRR
jgi:hypothetical protein